MQVLGIADATAITAGVWYSCALHQTGTISCWGYNNLGQLGNGNQAISVIPMQVVGITDAAAIAADDIHSCALHQNGTISCWGSNGSGLLGNGRGGVNVNSSVPVQVTGITDATAITGGQRHSCALHQNGTISCWGRGSEGTLGSGRNADSFVPVQVTGISDATAIAHSCALRRTGTISCWGYNAWGQLGNGQSGNDASTSVPVQVFGITDATAIAAGDGHSCALRQNGTISCWGNNYHGQLGNGQNRQNSSIPVQVTGITDATAITAGPGHSCALHQGGTVSCWGNNEHGELGDGTTRNSSTPVRVTGFGG